MLAGRGGAQIIYSAAADRQSAPHSGVVSLHFLRPLGYEHHDVRLPRSPSFRCVSLTSAPMDGCFPRLTRSSPFRPISLANPLAPVRSPAAELTVLQGFGGFAHAVPSTCGQLRSRRSSHARLLQRSCNDPDVRRILGNYRWFRRGLVAGPPTAPVAVSSAIKGVVRTARSTLNANALRAGARLGEVRNAFSGCARSRSGGR
jgi:hypothetical protein